jgi:Flp pilus assembly protein TadD
LDKTGDQQTRTESRTQLVAESDACLRSGNYSRALDLLRDGAAEFANDAELAELENRAHDGIKRKSEADRLITQSQELFAQRQSAEAIQLLREAYELDKNNSLARSILANALVEHANSIVETEWWEAESMSRQALQLNPAHPTAKAIYSLIIERKKASSVEEWVARAGKLQTSGDLFAALAWVAEGLAVHPDDPKLLHIQHAIQREQAARRRQARRGDLQDLRQMELEIDRASGAATKQALAERIQALAARYWTDGEILAIANGFLQRLGLIAQGNPAASLHSKDATVIFHVPLPKASGAATSKAPASPVLRKQVSPIPHADGSTDEEPGHVHPLHNDTIATKQGSPQTGQANKIATVPEPEPPQPEAPVSVPQSSAPLVKVTPRSSQAKKPTRPASIVLVLGSVASIVFFATMFFLVRKHHAPALEKITPAAPTIAAEPKISARVPSVPATSAPTVSSPAETTPESVVGVPASSGTVAEKAGPDNAVPTDLAHNFGTLLVVAGQDGARVFLNGKPQQLTQSGQLRLPNLEPHDYVVEVTKSGFQDPPAQTIRIRKGEQAKVSFNLQPQPRLASLMIQGGAPGTTVLVDQNPVGTIQSDGTFSVSTVNPGDHIVELRKDRFKPRQVKKRFVAGAAVTLASADAALEAAPGELKITFAPADAKVAIAKGDFLKMVSSGVPLNLAPGTYTLTARTAERFTRSSTIEVVAGQPKSLDLSLAPSGMAKWDNPGAWKHEKDAFIRKGGEFVLYGVIPTSGTFVFSAMLTKGHLLQWVLNYAGPNNYMLFQLDDKNFYRSVIRNGQKTDEIIVPHKGDKKSFRTLQLTVSPTEIIQQIKDGNSWTVLDRWTQPGANPSLGEFGFYLPGSDEVALSSFAHYADLNIR